MNIEIEHRNPGVAAYQDLRKSTGWEELDDEAVNIALSNSIFSVCVMVENMTIGMGRIIGDGAVYFYIQDVIVLPDFHKMGIGKLIMNELEKWLKLHACKNSFVGLMAAEGVMDFYKKFGYKERHPDKPGMYKLMDSSSDSKSNKP